MRSAPLAIDLFCGLGGWTEGLLAAGFQVIGFDIERHLYGPNDEHRYPAQLVLQDVRTLTGAQLVRAGIRLIVASSPCQNYSWMAMPWSRAKQVARALRGMDVFPENYKGPRTVAELNELFEQPARLQREMYEITGQWVPMIQENVRGAQPWVGRARWSYGSYYLWGDVPALMPMTLRRVAKVATMGAGWYPTGHPKHVAGLAFNTHADRATKNAGGSWFNIANNKGSGHGANPVREGVKVGGEWFHDSSPGAIRSTSSKSTARKAASMRIAKIPRALAQHIATVYYPLIAQEIVS